MTKQVFTIGYGGKTPAQIKAIVDDLDAVLFDIRFSPRSRQPQWAKKNVAALVGVERYTHLKALGNVNYKGGPIEFVDWEAGLQAIEQSDKPVILMCVCKDRHTCHRTTAAEQLKHLGYEVQELLATPAAPAQLSFIPGSHR